ncbi:MAG: tRNA (adenosine(37)-N6)-threonylcarbamoyltransferase complex dimerization subunit type 1 TsaB [Lachnospiraceae bacterium]|nr:tRNA (adenosine(37)-N6)-threonylcarbamoyltransferase complex dimerization subunit type 1 TsaB [Lachnospiraceae bacterium]
MKILAIDSSGLVATVALLEDEDLIAEYTVHYKKTHSQTLLPMLDEIRTMAELDLKTIDAIAVASGPGSFTGLRIGSATAKGLAQGLEKPIIEVPTLEGLAWQMYGSSALVCPLMDARRNQVYAGIYAFAPMGQSEEMAKPEKGDTTPGNNMTEKRAEPDGNMSQEYEMTCLMEGVCCLLPEVVERLNGLGKPVVLLGDGVQAYRETLKETLKVPYTFAPAHRRLQSAAAVGALALRYAAQGRMVSCYEHKPEYFRLSQAERELAEKKAGSPDMSDFEKDGKMARTHGFEKTGEAGQTEEPEREA